MYRTPKRAAGTGIIMYSIIMLVGLFKMLHITTADTVIIQSRKIT
jgi:hypothetical protein